MSTEPDSTESDAVEYRVCLDRERCDGIFACLVRDDRFVEAADGLATIRSGETGAKDGTIEESERAVVAAFADDRLAAARQAARACPVGAIEVREGGDE